MLKVLMYGWEFPPKISGGLGVACYEIVQALLQQGVQLNLVLPNTLTGGNQRVFTSQEMNLVMQNVQASFIKVPVEIPFSINPYGNQIKVGGTSQETLKEFLNLIGQLHLPDTIKNLLGNLWREHDPQILGNQYGVSLISEVLRYAGLAGPLAEEMDLDLIYAHDWLTILAALEAKARTNKPVVFHVHALETDRCSGRGNEQIFAIEKFGLEQADQIITVSQYTKNNISHFYQINPDKITVVHNGISPGWINLKAKRAKAPNQAKIVLFLGRLTYQKGPYFFIEVAKKILAQRPEVQFVLAGTGDLLVSMVEHTAALKIGSNVHFTGFLDQKQVKAIYQLADVYVMPSVSEPFGLSALEAVANGIPVVLSKQSGAAEVLNHTLVADFWDTDELANKILALLGHPRLAAQSVQESVAELKQLTWDRAAKKIIKVYERLTS